MLGKQGRLDVEETLSGSVELRTPGMAADTSGPAALGRTYVSASRESRGEVTFRPYITQQAYALTRTFSGERMEWTVALEGASLADIAFAPDNRVAVAACRGRFRRIDGCRDVHVRFRGFDERSRR